MPKTVAILQPSYLPWLGFFDQMARADVFVLYDDVQYTKNDWRNRNRIKTPNGPMWLTVPMDRRSPHGHIRDALIAVDNRWRSDHLKAMEMNYARAPFWPEVSVLMEPLFWRQLTLFDLCGDILDVLYTYLNLKAVVTRSSSIGYANLVGTERLVAICRALEATDYLTGDAAQNYLEVDKFSKAGITVHWQNYQHPVYPQLWGPFVSHLSIMDLLFNCGPRSLEILKNA